MFHNEEKTPSPDLDYASAFENYTLSEVTASHHSSFFCILSLHSHSYFKENVLNGVIDALEKLNEPMGVFLSGRRPRIHQLRISHEKFGSILFHLTPGVEVREKVRWFINPYLSETYYCPLEFHIEVHAPVH